ncbi:hypothetical protein AB0G02_27475, partial [Actinosynnema sp. NPDC023658]
MRILAGSREDMRVTGPVDRRISMTSPYGLHRVLDPVGVLPQQAYRLDATPVCGADEVLLDVDRLNLDAASYRQLREEHGVDGVRRAVSDIVAARGKM